MLALAALLAVLSGVSTASRAAAPASKCVGSLQSSAYSVHEPGYAASYGSLSDSATYTFIVPSCAQVTPFNCPYPTSKCTSGQYFTTGVYLAGTSTSAPDPLFATGSDPDWGLVLLSPGNGPVAPAGCETYAVSMNVITYDPTSTGSGPSKQVSFKVSWNSPIADTSNGRCGGAPPVCTCSIKGTRGTQSATDDCPGAGKLTAENVDALVAGLKKNAHLYLSATRDKNEQAQYKKLDGLLDQLTNIAKAAANDKLTPQQRQDVLVNAVVDLAGEVAGDKYQGKDIADQVKAAITTATAQGGNSDTLKSQVLDKEIKTLIGKAVKGSGVTAPELQKQFGDLTDQFVTLGHLAFGNMTDEEKSDALGKAVTGLLERTVFNGLLNASYLKAATQGYELGKPFGQFLQKNLGAVLNAQLLGAAKSALDTADANWRSNLEDGTKTSVVGTIELPAEFKGWQVTAYTDSDCKTQVQIVGTPISTIGAFLGKHPDTYLVDASQLR